MLWVWEGLYYDLNTKKGISFRGPWPPPRGSAPWTPARRRCPLDPGDIFARSNNLPYCRPWCHLKVISRIFKKNWVVQRIGPTFLFSITINPHLLSTTLIEKRESPVTTLPEKKKRGQRSLDFNFAVLNLCRCTQSMLLIVWMDCDGVKKKYIGQFHLTIFELKQNFWVKKRHFNFNRPNCSWVIDQNNMLLWSILVRGAVSP